MLVNHKRVSRILREDSLIAAALAEPRKKPRPDRMVNLAGGMQVTGINQLCWIDYIIRFLSLDEFSARRPFFSHLSSGPKNYVLSNLT